MSDLDQSPTCGKPTSGGPCVRVVGHSGICEPDTSGMTDTTTVNIDSDFHVREWWIDKEVK